MRLQCTCTDSDKGDGDIAGLNWRRKLRVVFCMKLPKSIVQEKQMIGVLSKWMIEMFVVIDPQTWQDWKISVESFLKEEASSNHQIYLSPNIALIEVLFWSLIAVSAVTACMSLVHSDGRLQLCSYAATQARSRFPGHSVNQRRWRGKKQPVFLVTPGETTSWEQPSLQEQILGLWLDRRFII